jgi:AAA15 family ATPase/GTPase
MLLRFSVSNWMSFRDEATLNMIATREEQHTKHLAVVEKHNLKLLPVAAIYGPNASGKSNLVKALRFAERLVLDPPKGEAPVIVKPFRLSGDSPERPTKFRFEILIEDVVYLYAFSVATGRIVHEELSRLNSRSEETLFRRGILEEDFVLPKGIDQYEEQRFAFRGTRDNQLYLTNSVSQKLTTFKPVFDWFRSSLLIVDPNMHFGGLPDITDEGSPPFTKMKRRLHDLDTGIGSICFADVPPESVMPPEILENLSAVLKEGASYPLEQLGGEDGVFVRKESGRLIVRRVNLIHRSQTGEEARFDFSEESDGNRRLLDLLPTFLVLEGTGSSLVFVIDELDRSLHSNLTKSLLENFLARRTKGSRSQLIFTTHDTRIMTQEIFRRDEIWITERDRFGASSIVAFSEFKDVRKDRDIRKSYLQGRLGGVPRIKSMDTPCEEEVEAR